MKFVVRCENMIEVGHCINCCVEIDRQKLCNPNNPNIKHLSIDSCGFCKGIKGIKTNVWR